MRAMPVVLALTALLTSACDPPPPAPQPESASVDVNSEVGASPSAPVDIDYLIGGAPEWEIRLRKVQSSVDGIRLTVTYLNLTEETAYLVCGSESGDSHLSFENARVDMNDGYCFGRIGQSIEVGPGETLISWGNFPVTDRAGQRFALTWWNWGTTPPDILAPPR